MLLGFLGFDTSVGELAMLAGTTSQGTTFYGMIQAAAHYGVTLTGVQLDGNQLKSGDIVLLDVGGYYHYSFVIQRLGDFIVLQDPAYGIRILSLSEFNKIYTGYALTTKNGIGFPLSDDQLNSFTGGNANIGATLFDTLLVMAGVLATSVSAAVSSAWFPPLALAIFVGGLIFFGGNALLDRFAPDLIPRKGTGWDGLIKDTINLPSYLLESLKSNSDFQKELNKISQGNPNNNEGTLLGKLWVNCDMFPFPGNYVCKTGVVSFLPGLILVAVGTGISPANAVDFIFNIPNYISNIPRAIFNIPNVLSDFWKRITDYKPSPIPTMSTMNNTNFTFKSSTISPMMINVPVIVNGISNGINGIGEWLADAQKSFAPTLDYLKNGFILAAVKNIPGAKTIAAAARSSYQTLKTGYDAVKNAWGSFSNGVKQEIASLTSNPVDYINNKFNQGVSWAKNELYKVGKTIYKGLSWAGSKVQSGINWVGSQVKSGISWVANQVQSGINWLGNQVQSGWNWLW